MARTLDSSNCIAMLQVSNLYPVPQQLQGFSTDTAYDSPEITPVEAVIGVDGKKSQGFTPTLKEINFVLQADSESNDIVTNWYQAMNASKSSDFLANLIIRVPGLGKTYTCTKGSLTKYKPLAGAKKTLQERPFTITFEDIIEAPL